MKHIVLFALLIAGPALAGSGADDGSAMIPRPANLAIASDDAQVKQCKAECAAKQELCTRQCLGNGQCFANCMKERDDCEARCSSR